MRSKGTKLQLEVRRLVAISLLTAGWGIGQVVRHVKASPTAVWRWRDTVAQHGASSLDVKRQHGASLCPPQEDKTIEPWHASMQRLAGCALRFIIEPRLNPLFSFLATVNF
jgi:hypothetical protein